VPLPTISVIILSFNRREALGRTLREVLAQVWARDAQVIVVDNASADGSAHMVRETFPTVELVGLAMNTAIAGFNIGAQQARGDILLILDDDSWPDPGAIESAIAVFEADPRIGGLMLHRRHPRTHGYEWPFDQPSLKGPQHNWPDMGCGNMVRTEAWRKVGGYEVGYFLYRNDTDLALKLLNAGYDVVFDPALLVWHDSFIVTKKSDRWLHLSTRNWMWLAKRHARGWTRFKGMLLGWLHSHRLAGFRFSGHAATLRGMLQGVFRNAPPMPPGVVVRNEHYWRLLALKMRYRQR